MGFKFSHIKAQVKNKEKKCNVKPQFEVEGLEIGRGMKMRRTKGSWQLLLRDAKMESFVTKSSSF